MYEVCDLRYFGGACLLSPRPVSLLATKLPRAAPDRTSESRFTSAGRVTIAPEQRSAPLPVADCRCRCGMCLAVTRGCHGASIQDLTPIRADRHTTMCYLHTAFGGERNAPVGGRGKGATTAS